MGEEYEEQIDEDYFNQIPQQSTRDTLASYQNLQDMQDDNLISYQLNTDEILQKIQRFLRGDVLVEDEEGNLNYEIPDDQKLKNLNEYGVAEMMRIISMYINKEHLLSNYDSERVFEILADLGDQLAKFMYCNYEKIGLDGEYKKTKFELIVLNILHLIESTYRRALGGEERENIKTGRIITQQQPLGQNYLQNKFKMPKKKFNLFDRKTW